MLLNACFALKLLALKRGFVSGQRKNTFALFSADKFIFNLAKRKRKLSCPQYVRAYFLNGTLL